MTHFITLLLMSIGVYFVNPTSENFTKNRAFKKTTFAKSSIDPIQYGGTEDWDDE
jgi:hypothetical protein